MTANICSPVKPIRVLALATEWGVSQGGVSAWNMEFCRALSQAGHNVTCGVVSDLGITYKKVRSISTVEVKYGPSMALLGTDFDVIIGHGLHTGPHARYYRKEYFKDARYVHIQHVDHIIEEYKNQQGGMEKVDSKEALSRKLLASANLVVGVGPRLTRIANRLLSSSIAQVPVLRLDPGIPSHIHKANLRVNNRSQTGILLVVGRAEDWELKGFDIAAQVAAKLSPRVELLRIRGVPPKGEEQLRGELRKHYQHLDLRPFQGPEAVVIDLMEADCVLLPSRHEGFGLSAFEALCLGVPTIVTSSSGLADLIKEKCPRQISERIIVEAEDVDEWSKKTKWALDHNNYKTFVECRQILRKCCVWSEAVKQFMKQLKLQ